MNCPVCCRSLAPTLSICPTCGAMMRDTVREDLQSKITPGIVVSNRTGAEMSPALKAYPTRSVLAASPPERRETAELIAPRTSPNLVEFQNKKSALPDWRIQLQNAVQQRKGGDRAAADAPKNSSQFPVKPAAALKMSPDRVEKARAPKVSDPRVANAMRRIEESRKAFLTPQAGPKKAMPARVSTRQPLGLVSPMGNTSAAAAPALAPIIATPEPQLVDPPTPVLEKPDTNKLPPIQEVRERAAVIAEPIIDITKSETLPKEFAQINRIRIRAENSGGGYDEIPDTQSDEIEDLAPVSMRFGAGLFDLIIGAFAAMLLLSPVAFAGGNWLSVSGLLVFGGTTAITMFLYMTACLGLFGKTMGMRLFSLELVDAVENEYPTLHQAAVSSSVYILSLLFAGAGFLTLFFNEEKRALHDLLSGTILVRDF